MYPGKNIKFDNLLDSDLSLNVLADLFEASIRILLENAVKYNDNNPIVKVSAIRDDSFISISVKDNGKGIPTNIQKKIFKPYFTSDKSSGTGIGLFYAKRIIDAHGGKISVKSEPDKGSNFKIKIPLR